jgi:hypothetical protein
MHSRTWNLIRLVAVPAITLTAIAGTAPALAAPGTSPPAARVGGLAATQPVSGHEAVPASQNSEPCKFPVKSPPKQGADNAINCRSTAPDIKLYVTNNGDTSGCTFNYTISWGDRSDKAHLTNVPGGAPGLELLASHTYADFGVFTISVTGSVASGNCTFTGGDLQFSYISPHTPEPEGPPISVQEMLARAGTWTRTQVPYSQVQFHSDVDGTYRQDCSGYVSMAWDLDHSLSTATLPSVTEEVGETSRGGLKHIEPGDIILRSGANAHVFLFVRWANDNRSKAVVDEETGTSSPTPYAIRKTLGVSSFNGFTVYRYKDLAPSK